MQKNKEVHAATSPRERASALIRAFQDAPMRADIEIRCNPPGQPAAVCVSIGGHDYAVLASEARTIADIFEKALNADPEIGKAEGFPNFIMGLRAGADKADATV